LAVTGMDPNVVVREAADLEAALEASRFEAVMETSRLEAVMAASRVEAEAVAARAAAASRAEAASTAVTAVSSSSMVVPTASSSSAAGAATVATPLPEVCAICYETPEPLEVALLPTCSHSYWYVKGVVVDSAFWLGDAHSGCSWRAMR